MVEEADWSQQGACSLRNFSGDFQDGEQGEHLGVMVLVGRFVFGVDDQSTT